MKTLQEHYKAIQNGQGNKSQFLKQARLLFPDYFNQYTNYDNAVSVLKSKQIISEAAGGVVSKGFDIFDWKKILENLKPEDLEIGKIYKYSGEITMGPHKGEKITGELEFEEKINDDMFRFIWKKIDTPNAPNARVGRSFQTSKTGLQYLTESVKAVEKETSKEVLDYRKNAYDNANMKNADNINFNEIMKGFYCELKDEKNAGKTGDELKEIVVKNLAKDPLYYTKNGEFGVKGVGYTTEAPGLGEPKAPKGKHKSSGYGDLKEGYDSKAGLSKKEQDKISDLSKEEKKALDNDLTDAMSDINNQDFKDKASYAKAMKAAKTKVYKKHNILQENTDILDYYASTIEANNMTEDEAYAYLEDIGLPHFQINSIINYVFPIKADKDIPSQGMTESERKLRSLVRDIIKEELNKEDYKTELRKLERPHTKDKKALDDIIDIYKSQIQGLDSIKKNINEANLSEDMNNPAYIANYIAGAFKDDIIPGSAKFTYGPDNEGTYHLKFQLGFDFLDSYTSDEFENELQNQIGGRSYGGPGQAFSSTNVSYEGEKNGKYIFGVYQRGGYDI